jgi:hypothetical protein
MSFFFRMLTMTLILFHDSFYEMQILYSHAIHSIPSHYAPSSMFFCRLHMVIKKAFSSPSPTILSLVATKNVEFRLVRLYDSFPVFNNAFSSYFAKAKQYFLCLFDNSGFLTLMYILTPCF